VYRSTNIIEMANMFKIKWRGVNCFFFCPSVRVFISKMSINVSEKGHVDVV